jgi:hypothetical protein
MTSLLALPFRFATGQVNPCFPNPSLFICSYFLLPFPLLLLPFSHFNIYPSLTLPSPSSLPSLLSFSPSFFWDVPVFEPSLQSSKILSCILLFSCTKMDWRGGILALGDHVQRSRATGSRLSFCCSPYRLSQKDDSKKPKKLRTKMFLYFVVFTLSPLFFLVLIYVY